MKFTPTSKEVESQGQNEKTGKTWTKFKYEGQTDNGEVKTMFLFIDLQVGTDYELAQYESKKVNPKTGKPYLNWDLKKPGTVDTSALMDKLAVLETGITEILKRTEHMERSEKPETDDVPF